MDQVAVGSNPIAHPILFAPVVQWIERQTSDLYVGGSSPPGRVKFALLAQLAEHPTLNRMVEGSIPSRRTNKFSLRQCHDEAVGKEGTCSTITP